MSTQTLLLQLQNSAVAHAISKSDHLVGATLQVAHILGFVLLLSAETLLALHLSGRLFAQHPTATVYAGLKRYLWGGLLLTASSGVLMFVSSAVLYGSKPVFAAKVLLFLVATLVQWGGITRHLRLRQTPVPHPDWRTYTTLTLSALLWLGVASAGRAIGFV